MQHYKSLNALPKNPHGYLILEQCYLFSLDPKIPTANDKEWRMAA